MLVLVVSFFLLLTLLMLAASVLMKGTKFRFDFIFLSVIFITAFYLAPMVLTVNDGYFTYLGTNYHVSESDIFRHVLALAIFVIGFLVFDLFIFRSTKSQIRREPILTSVRFITISAAIIYFIFFGAYYFNYTEAMSMARRGELELNPLIAVLFSFAQSLGIFCIFEAKKRKSLGIFILFAVPIVFLTLSVAGRTNVLSTIILLLIFFRLPVKTAILLSIVSASAILPVLLNGKSVIYLLATGSSLSEILEVAYSPVDTAIAISNNFGHVFLSFQLSDRLVNLVGYRFFYDYIQGFLFYLKLFGIPIADSLTYFNTEIIYNVRMSMIPVGYLAFGYVQLGFLGIFVSGAFYRFIGYLAEIVYLRLNFSGSMPRFYLAFLAANTFYVGEVRTMVLTIFIPLFFMYMLTRIAIRKQQQASLRPTIGKPPPNHPAAP